MIIDHAIPWPTLSHIIQVVHDQSRGVRSKTDELHGRNIGTPFEEERHDSALEKSASQPIFPLRVIVDFRPG